ncbi:restriction endonuclease subunit S [Dysgonomonas sp. Marseille-P4677]|uniref:restriction endonuclease subunit S n=1 Tax=Dysgonomonas sp. Marseille-P4677 TaxID=2364790 RepID=UPI0019129B2D|nr:restriction endonuclease subunit S [Dysgonomonas sp. Marseille-P4677]MBK5720193.1 restriction endonuclease subunit S [Dysgonomonas sp. Marseille-P4677]
MKRYPEYKDSSIEWIGMIPEHWEVRKIKTFSPVKRGASPRPIDNPIYFDDNGEYAWVRIADVTASERYLTSTTQNLSELGSSLSVKRKPNDFFLSIAATVGKPIITKIKCCIHDGFVWFPKLKMNPEYLYYIFTSGQPYLGLGKMGTQLNLNTETVGGISIPVPNDEEVNQIVSFLDKETTRIDNIIATRKKQIDLLKELKSSIISRAVTKGLNPDVVMKDCGIEWIGEIPEHWEVRKIKNIITLLTDYDANGSFSDIAKNTNINNGNPYAWMVRATDLVNKRYGIVEGNNYCDIETYKYLKKSSLKPFDLLIAKRGEIGNVYLVPDYKSPMTLAPNTYLLKLNTSIISSYYLFFVLSSNIGKEQLKLNNKSTAIGALYKDDVKSIYVSLPSLSEQQEIVTYIENKTAKIDTSIEKFQKQIDLLTEYRSSLITEAVTGKIDVRS